MKCSVSVVVASCAVACLWIANAQAEQPEGQIQQHVEAGEFGVATRLADSLPEGRDHWLGQIAVAQARGGSPAGSQSTLRRIRDTGSLSGAINAIGAENQAAGGGTMADFDTLIDLIESTVAPDSWVDVGGTGSIESFEGGVYVNTAGVLKQVQQGRATRRSLDELRSSAKDRGRRSSDARAASDLRMVSLPRLQRELQIRQAFGNEPTDAMRHLAGLQEVRFVFVYPESGDVVIAGPAGDWQTNDEGVAVNTMDGKPVLLLDDLVVLIRNAANLGGRFGCSITPQRENLARTQQVLARRRRPLRPSQTSQWFEQLRATLGLQNIEIHGVDPGSHVARVMVAADYHMKLVGMGLVPSVDGVTNYLDSVDPRTPPDMDVLRWWFTLHAETLTRNESGNAFELGKQTTQLQSENELLEATGERIHTGTSSELNRQFADSFTTHFAALADRYPIYHQLENIFDLAVVAALVSHDAVADSVRWDLNWLLDEAAYRVEVGTVPNQVPSIMNHRVVSGRKVIAGVSGGVSAQTRLVLHRMRTTSRDDIDSDRDRSRGVLPPDNERWWWD